MLLLSVRQWRGRPRGDADPPAPKWMAAIDGFTPVRSAGLAVLLGDELKSWMIRNNAAIMAVLLLVLGAKMLGDGLSTL